MEPSLTVRSSLRRGAVLALASLAFVVVGIVLLTEPGRAGSLWNAPAGQAFKAVVGVVGIVFGLAGAIACFYTVTRPLLRLYPDRLDDPRRKLIIPFSDVRELKRVGQRATGEARWLQLRMHDPARYALLERASKVTGLQQWDVTLDLTLASPDDFEKAYDFIRQRVPESQS